MKKLLLALIAMVACTTINAKVVKITLEDNSELFFASAQLGAIDFNEDGTATVTDYTGQVCQIFTNYFVAQPLENINIKEVSIFDKEAIVAVRDIKMVIYKETITSFFSNPEAANTSLDLLTTDWSEVDWSSIDWSQFDIPGAGSPTTGDDPGAGGDPGTGEWTMPEPLYERNVKQINFYYPSVDPFGERVTLSGVIWIPENIWNKEDPSNGIILMNHFTNTSSFSLPSNGNPTYESFVLCNPLMPNYIMVESDFYGWGASVRYPQAYCQGEPNGFASVDALLTARRLLKKMKVNAGELNFNIGYSSSGFDALSTQRVRDKYYCDALSFDKTFAGGSPSDMKRCYIDMVAMDTTSLAVAVPLVWYSTMESRNDIDITLEDAFAPNIAQMIPWLIGSKWFDPMTINMFLGTSKVKEMLNPAYCDMSTDESRHIQDIFRKMSLTTDWIPDPSQRIYLMHPRTDDCIPVQSGRAMIKHLKKYGFEPSIIPGATNLQTNFVMSTGHLEGMIPWFVQTLSAIQSWPQMYENGQMKPAYRALLNLAKADPIAIMRYLGYLGFDVRGMVQQLIEENPDIVDNGIEDMAVLEEELDAICQEMGLSLNDVMEMMEDSGIDFETFIMDLIEYISSNPSRDIMKADIRSLRSAGEEINPVEENENKLYDWLEANGIKTPYTK